MRCATLLLTGLTLVACTPAPSERAEGKPITTPEAVPWVFSTMYYNEEGGDPLGDEVSLRTLNGEMLATFQQAEGSISRCDSLPVEREGLRIKFRLPAESVWRYLGSIREAWVEASPMVVVTGLLSPDTLRLEVPYVADDEPGVDTLVLPRTYRPYRPDCVGLPD